jgi:uncharacterized YigZ family protein
VEYLQSNSRFLATIDRIESVEAARLLLRSVREEMPDATHHVHAFRIGHGASVTEGMSDDGEPSGTSGPPVLAVLRGSGLGDSMVIVTRYYGGTKLGTGGLVAAYGRAARAVLESCPREPRIIRLPIRFRLQYPAYEGATRLVADVDGLLGDCLFAEAVVVRALVPAEHHEHFRARLRDLTAGSVEWLEIDSD